MARTFTDTTDGSPPVILIRGGGTENVTIPDAALLFGADFARDGGDLVLRNPGSPDIRIVDYFDGGEPADLMSPEGAVIRGGTVAVLAGPEAPGQYAQVGARTSGDPIGQVENLTGEATVQRADGTVETLGSGSRIFLNDVLQTGADSKLSVTFVDGTIFTLSAASRMVLDELIYDPNGQDNFGSFNLIQGGFVFIAGQVAKTGGMDVTTPAATMGIKGTTVLVELQTDNGVASAQVTLLRDPDGDVGRVELFDLGQNLIATITEANSSWIISTVEGETREVERTGDPDAADTLLIAEAIAAYQSAFGRVGQGGSFVELDNVLRGGTGGGQGESDGDGIDLDSNDADELPELAPPPTITPGGGDSFDEGRNGFLAPELPAIVVTGDDAGRVRDGESTVADGRLAALDAGAVTALTWSGSADGVFGSLTVEPDGEWRYIANPAIVRLDEGETAVETFIAVITDEAGRTATQTITITVVGAGDAPVSVTPPSEAARTIAEAVGATATGRLTATDPDAGSVLTWSGSTNGAFGTFTVAPDGAWTYVAGPAVRQLEDGQTATETFTATVTDQTGRSADQTVRSRRGGDPRSPRQAARTLGGRRARPRPRRGLLTGPAPRPAPSFTVAPDGRTYVAGPPTAATPDRHRPDRTHDDGHDRRQRRARPNDDGGQRLWNRRGRGNGSRERQAHCDRPRRRRNPDMVGHATSPFGTFTVLPNGDWSFLANGSIATLPKGAAVTQTFSATVTDENGATATQAVVVTILGTNQAPTSSDGDFEAAKGGAVSGTLLAQDVDAGDVLSFAPGTRAPANGTVVISTDGSFTYTPRADFQGLDSFDFVVTDGQGGSSTSRVTVAVLSPSGSGSGGSSVSLDITGAPGAEPAGTVISTASPVDASGVNLVIALDRSGSIGATQWNVQINQVADALEALAARFAGAATSVDVRIVTYATTATATGTFDLTDPDLIATVRSLPYTGGLTNYTAALTLTEAFFDSQPPGEANFLYFITDGEPTETGWPTVLNRLKDADAKGYTVQIEAFGIGNRIDFDTLSAFDPNPEILAGANELTDAFTATPLYSADLVSLKVELIADGVDRGVIATETSPGVVSGGLVTTLSLADIAGLADLLGASNRISATAGYDLDGDPSTVEIELFDSIVLAKAETAQTLTGTAGSDLLFGSDLDDDLTGGPGNDIILGFGGNDTIRPGAGIDTVLAGAGDDRIILTTAETASTSGRKLLDGGEGRDTLQIDFGGNLNTGLLDLIDLRGIEVIDMENGQANTLRLTLSDVLGMSDETDTEIEALLGGLVPNARTILGDASDSLVLEGAMKSGTVTDGSGRTLDIFSFTNGSDVLATLAVDADVAVSTQSAVA
jgi:large repetitive protein